MNMRDRRVSEYPAQTWARMCEAVYMIGFISDFDEATCRKLWAKLQRRVADGKVRKLTDRSGHDVYQIVKQTAEVDQ